MKQAFILAALALVAAFPARAGQEVCFDVLTNIRDDNGREVMQRVCAEEGNPLPVKLRMVEKVIDESKLQSIEWWNANQLIYSQPLGHIGGREQ